uniref:Uncharacterized protein n=1 Tax=Faecalibaculum rodentium TaxID=1702221 RepID=A0A140DTQ8_9FIRM|nr:hypothetical protein AALO17_09010 [Faecalibaculum rodentium]
MNLFQGECKDQELRKAGFSQSCENPAGSLSVSCLCAGQTVQLTVFSISIRMVM